jgi:hypothetical protein
MNEDYLWDRSGEPDSEVVKLEKLLEPYALREREPQPVRPAAQWRKKAVSIPIALAAAAVVAALVWLPSHRVTSWTVVAGKAAPRALRAGELIETGPSTAATISDDAVGEVDLDPSSRLRISSSQKQRQRFDLERGVIHARIWAPPAEFIVDTPSAEAVDLGCSYTLEVGPDGSGRVVVETGWVAFKWRQRESFILAAASCAIHRGKGPGTPSFLDAAASFRQAVAHFDEAGDQASLDTVVQSARARDALTLWHLLGRTEGVRRETVFKRFAALTQFPYAENEAAILRGNSNAFDAAWNAMKLGDASFWREWEQRLR